MAGRMMTDDSYRFGFNGKEKDSDGEWGNSAHYDYGFRIYDPSIARFLSVDPLTADYPSWSPYPFGMNRPIDGIDLDGLEWRNSTNNEINSYNEDNYTAEQQGVYKTGDGGFFTWVGEEQWQLGDGTITNETPHPSQVSKKITFDEKIVPIPDSDVPYRHFKNDGKIKDIYHDFSLAPWMHDAWFYKEIGLAEVPGTENNPMIMDMHNAAINGWIPPNDDNEGPWCSSFACSVMDSGYSPLYSNLESPKNAYSLSWRSWGKEISEPVYGATAVKTRNGGGHVGFVVGQNLTGTKVAILGGNQNNAVNIRMYSKDVFRFFIPSNYKIPKFSEKLPLFNNNNNQRTSEQ